MDLTRRNFLVALGGLGLARGCPCNPPLPPAPTSPVYRGSSSVARAILGHAPGTRGFPVPEMLMGTSASISCPSGTLSVPVPRVASAIVYYPAFTTSYDSSAAIAIDTRQPTWPVVLFAHARREPICTVALPPGLDPALADITQDFTRVDRVLDQLASHGFVVVAPDLSFLWNVTEDGAWPDLGSARAQILVALYQYLASINASVFQHRLDLSRLALAGHSTGGAACLIARDHMPTTPLAMAMLAPATTSAIAALAGKTPPLLALKGTVDTLQGANPDAVIAASPGPKVLVTVGGANHFGYTNVCTPDNHKCAAEDGAGTISTFSQQTVAATFLAAHFLRFVLGNTTMTPYLNGTQDTGLAQFGASSIQVAATGI